MLGCQSKLIKALSFIYKKPGLSDEDFKSYYENKHAPLANSLLTFEGYERNYIHSNANTLHLSLGSISIFKYQSKKSLAIIGEQMSSNAGDTLREDELNFMNVESNFYIFSNSVESHFEKYAKKIFLIASLESEITLIDTMTGIKKISDNLIEGHEYILAVPEYGITPNIKIKELEAITKDCPQAILVESCC